MTMTTMERAEEMREQLRELRERAKRLHENRRILVSQIGHAVVAGNPTTRLHVNRREIDDQLEEVYSAISVLEEQVRHREQQPQRST